MGDRMTDDKFVTDQSLQKWMQKHVDKDKDKDGREGEYEFEWDPDFVEKLDEAPWVSIQYDLRCAKARTTSLLAQSALLPESPQKSSIM